MTIDVTARQSTPVDLLETPDGTLSVIVWNDGMVAVVGDPDRTQQDWDTVLDYLAVLGTAPLGQCAFEGECDVWSTRLTPAA
jgi:hypothetical protein